MHESESEVAQSYLTLSDPMDCSLPGSSIHGIFQARVLEWGAIALESKLSFFILKIIFYFKNCLLQKTDIFLQATQNDQWLYTPQLKQIL